jgi:imidazole glycerol phosphate synthase subunit HisF
MIFSRIDLMEGKVAPPVIGSGAAGSPEHFVRALTGQCAGAASTASLYRDDKRGIPVRVAA